MKKKEKKGKVMWGFIYVGAFIATFAISAIIKISYNPLGKKYKLIPAATYPFEHSHFNIWESSLLSPDVKPPAWR